MSAHPALLKPCAPFPSHGTEQASMSSLNACGCRSTCLHTHTSRHRENCYIIRSRSGVDQVITAYKQPQRCCTTRNPGPCTPNTELSGYSQYSRHAWAIHSDRPTRATMAFSAAAPGP